MMLRRIALSGSGGTGKTTTSLMLSRRLGLPRVGEGVRDYLKRNGISHLRELSPEEVMKMQWHILTAKIDAERNLTDGFIADRSTIDNVAYALRWAAWDIPKGEMERYVAAAREHALRTYDIILFFPWGKFEVEDDGVRSPKPYYQYSISMLIKGILHDWELPYHEIREVTPENRLVEALSVIHRIGV